MVPREGLAVVSDYRFTTAKTLTLSLSRKVVLLSIRSVDLVAGRGLTFSPASPDRTIPYVEKCRIGATWRGVSSEKTESRLLGSEVRGGITVDWRINRGLWRMESRRSGTRAEIQLRSIDRLHSGQIPSARDKAARSARFLEPRAISLGYV